MAEGSKLDLRSLLQDLKEVTNWFQLGLWLGIKHANLTIIEKNHKDDTERCKEEMLAHWLRNFSNASRRKLVSALKEIGHRNLAEQLQQKYNVPQTDNFNRHLAMEAVESDELLSPLSSHSQELVRMRCIVNQQDKEVRREYAKFATDLRRLFERKGVSVDDAIYSFVYYLDESDLTSDMKEARNIGAFLLALKRTQSWYNFDTTAYLAEDLGDDEGKKLVETYEEKLKVHLTKQSKPFNKTRSRQFVVKVNNKREHFTDEKIIEFRSTIVRVMKIKHKELILKSIRDGCVELTYLFQSTLSLEIKHAICECSNDLKELQIISVSIIDNGEVIWFQQQESEVSQHQNLIHGRAEVTTKPKQLRGLDKITRSKINLPRQMKLRSFNPFGDDNHKSNYCKQPFCKLVSAVCCNAISKKRLLLIVLFLVIFFVILLYSQMLF